MFLIFSVKLTQFSMTESEVIFNETATETAGGAVNAWIEKHLAPVFPLAPLLPFLGAHWSVAPACLARGYHTICCHTARHTLQAAS